MLKHGLLALGIVLLVLAGLTAVGCSRAKAQPLLDPAATYAKAESFMTARKYTKAISWLQKVNTAQNRELRAQVHLRLADAYFEQKSILDLAEAKGRYQSFLNAFPLSGQASYAQYRFSQCLQRSLNKPERDQGPTFQAMGEFRKVQDLYPNSPWVDEANVEIAALEDLLSRDALLKARFYYQRKSFAAADVRLRNILRDNPDWEGRDEVLYLLGMSLRIRGQVAAGDDVLARLQSDFPESEYGRKARKVLNRSGPASEQPAAGASG